MKWSVLCLVIAVSLGVCWGQFLNNRPYPTYSLERMPDTSFTCRSKVLGGYYADSETQCQMFHVCVKVPGLGVQDFRFLCPNGTAFDQDAQICADWDDVDCEAATLYYSSDNFDLYRVGSGFETVPFPGEDEATFHLQRSETGDQRLSRERESIRINQQTDYNTVRPPKRPEFHKERETLRGSSSSNFFNNKNGGKENDDDYDDTPINRNAEVPKKKIIRKLTRKEEVTTTTTTPRPTQRATFLNNFAGSPFVPSTTGRTISTTSSITSDQYTTAIQNYRGRQRGRNYNNAENFRTNENLRVSTTPSYENYKTQNTRENYEYKNTQNTRTEQFRISSGAPTRNEYRTTTQNQNTQSSPAPFRQENRQYKNLNRQEVTTQRFEQQRIRQQAAQGTPSGVPQNNYKPTQKFENTPTGAPFSKQTYQYDVTKIQSTKQTENYPSTPFNKKPTTFKTDNYPTTYSPNKNKYYPKPESSSVTPEIKTTQFDYNRQSSKSQYYQKETSSITPEVKSTQFDYNRQTSKQGQYYQKQESSSTTPEVKPTQFDYNRQSNYDYSFKQFSSTSRPTTAHTQYTPTVPKQSTTFFPTTQPSKFAKTFDYDDGSYNPKFDDEHYNPKYEDEKYKEDEFLKTAHSQNFASSRNELAQSQKISLPIPTKESPRPFSVSTPVPKPVTKPVQKLSTKSNDKDPKVIIGVKSTKEAKQKDASYDYAYYDTNVGSEPDYDIGTEFAKSNIKSKE